MVPKVNAQSPSRWLAAVDVALRLARVDAEELACATGTALVQMVDGQIVRVYPTAREPAGSDVPVRDAEG